jgi:flagellar biosynthetic protein FliR
MHGSVLFSLSTLIAFLLVLARIAGVFVFIPFPGAQSGVPIARVALSVVCTIALFPRWPSIESVPSMSLLIAWLVAEAVLGLLAGVIFQYIGEALTLGAQLLSLQAGYAYASTIDPATQADSGILLIFAQLASGLLFFTLGLDRLVIHAFALSLETCPPGSFIPTVAMAEHLIALGKGMFVLALRLSLPVIALLLMVDIALGVLGRVSAQLQLISLSFPLKMMLGLLMLAMLLPVFPHIYESHAMKLLTAVREVLTGQ